MVSFIKVDVGTGSRKNVDKVDIVKLATKEPRDRSLIEIGPESSLTEFVANNFILIRIKFLPYCFA